MNLRLPDVPEALPPSGDPRTPNWNAVWRHIQAEIPRSEWGRAWDAIAHDWVERIGMHLKGTYRLSSAPEFLLLAPPATIDEASELPFLVEARATIRRELGEMALGEILGPFVVLILAGHEEYYDFVGAYYPDAGGEWGTSGGMYINRGYGLIVTKDAPRRAVRPTLAHELVHAHLWHRNLPRWVEEGLTQMFEERLTRHVRFVVNAEMIARHRAFWTRQTLDQFWSGASFKRPDQGQELSYHLAQWLMRVMLADTPRQALEFIESAADEDSGEAAARSVFDTGLDGLVQRKLGLLPSN